MAKEALSQDLADFLVTKNFDPEYFDEQGQPAEAGEAKTVKFDYVSGTGKNYGTAVCVIADDELNLFYGDNLGRGMEPDDKQEWYEFLEQLSNQAASHSATWSPKDINQLKHTLAGIAAIKEGLFEGYYGNKKVSYMGEQTGARLMIQHNRTLGEADKRFRYVESLFIETADQERFRLPFKSLSGGRAMLEHVRQGGKPYDVRGNHITEIVSEMAVLSRFNRAQHNRVYEGVTQELVESAKQYYHNLQETMKHLGSTRGYQAYFESWAPDQIGEAEALVENLRNMFVEQTLDARIEAALPTLAKIQQQGNNMKEAQIFENWINNLSEGTWALPETPEQQEKLNQLMSAELIVGPDATNATELLYDIVGDDELFDILNDLADKSEGRANIWDDSDVQRRLAELGVQTPQSTEAEPSDVEQDTPPAMEEGFGDKNTSETRNNFINWITLKELDNYEDELLGYFDKFVDGGGSEYKAGEQAVNTWKQRMKRDGESVRKPDELAEMLRHAGVPVQESMLNDDTGNTWDHLLDRFKHEVENFRQTGDLDDDLYDALYDYYHHHGAMPYGVAKARTGDPYEWISDRFAQDIGLDEGWKGALAGGLAGAGLGSVVPALGTIAGGIAGAYAGHKIGDQGLSDPDKEWKSPEPKKPVSEGSCNMTMEGEYCPEHGLAECGGMYEADVGPAATAALQQGQSPTAVHYADISDKNAVSNANTAADVGKIMTSRIGENQQDDPINYNAAITGAYYEGKETKTQEGDALLARIKSLALLR